MFINLKLLLKASLKIKKQYRKVLKIMPEDQTKWTEDDLKRLNLLNA
jgi:hypothetical protein